MGNTCKTKFDILCVGACVQDILIEGMEESGFHNNVNIVNRATFTSGGDATNEAVVLSRLGDRTALLAKVDKGPVGNAVYLDLKNEGIDVSQIVRDKNCVTSTCFVAINNEGEHTFFLAKGKNEGISLPEIDLLVLKKARAISIGSLYTCYKLDQGGAAELMKIAKEAGIITFADVDHDVEKLGPNAMNCVFPFLDYLIPSIDEAKYITGMSCEKEAASELLKRGVKNVVIKLGGKGCFFKNCKEEFYVNPFEAEVKDTTGCGDNFTAGFIHYVLKGYGMYECAEFACAVGAVNAGAIGGHMGVKSEEQIKEFMKTAKRKEIWP